MAKKNANNKEKKAQDNNMIMGQPEGTKHHRIRFQFDIGYNGSPGKIMDDHSDTIPDLNLTVRQLLENHTRGKDSDVEVRQPLYLEFPVPVLNDLTDVDNYKEVVQEQLNRIEQWQRENPEEPTGSKEPKEGIKSEDPAKEDAVNEEKL